jgi:hypothetical protein
MVQWSVGVDTILILTQFEMKIDFNLLYIKDIHNFIKLVNKNGQSHPWI